MRTRHGFLVATLVAFTAADLRAEDRSYNGSGNNLASTATDALATAGTPMIRFGYGIDFGPILEPESRPNPRDISNTVFPQTGGVKSMRGLSDYAWGWGQFVTHDIELIKTDNGPEVNGAAPIAVNDPLDPLAPGPIPFVRADFGQGSGGGRRGGSGRSPVNYVSSYLDGSGVYGSDATRASALRDTGGKLLLDGAGLLPRNTAGLEVENNSPLPDTSMFLAGDIRANENPLLTSLHTVFAREHNRLVDAIAVQQPGLDDESRYQLARKLVGAEIQAITYNEYLPALVGDGSDTPRPEGRQYSGGLTAAVTNAFANAAFRIGHSQVSSNLLTVDDNGAEGQIPLRNAFHNPTLIDGEPTLVDDLLRGAARQRSEEVDAKIVDDLRNALFGPPGSGGLDLAAINIQRGRDAGLPDYAELRGRHGGGWIGEFDQITSDSGLAAAMAEAYGGDVNNIDAWVGGLAEDHYAGSSVGPLMRGVIVSQFQRLRDGDRLFYTGVDAGLYDAEGALDPAIAALVDLDTITLADVIEANTGVAGLQGNVFYAPGFAELNEGDLNGDGLVNAADYTVWRDGQAGERTADAAALWRNQYAFTLGTAGSPSQGGGIRSVPEPTAAALLACLGLAAFAGRSRRSA